MFTSPGVKQNNANKLIALARRKLYLLLLVKHSTPSKPQMTTKRPLTGLICPTASTNSNPPT